MGVGGMLELSSSWGKKPKTAECDLGLLGTLIVAISYTLIVKCI